MIIRYLGVLRCIFATGFVVNEMTRKQIRKQKKTNIMKTRIVLLSLLALLSILTSCNKTESVIIPSSHVTSIEKSLAVNSKLDVSGPFRVFVTFSETEERIIVNANENLHSYIAVENKNGWLTIGFQNDDMVSSRNRILNIYITTNNINEYQIEGAASVILENALYADDINIEMDGACLFFGTVYSNNLYTNLSGDSKIDVNGHTGLLDVITNGAGIIRSYYLKSNQLDADLNGASEVKVTVTEKLSIKANGGSTVFYKGNGQVESLKLNGGSSIKKMD